MQQRCGNGEGLGGDTEAIGCTIAAMVGHVLGVVIVINKEVARYNVVDNVSCCAV